MFFFAPNVTILLRISSKSVQYSCEEKEIIFVTGRNTGQKSRRTRQKTSSAIGQNL